MIEDKIQNNAALVCELAANGMVLLENHDELLPFAAGTRIAVFGKAQQEYFMCGKGSGSVLTAYKIDFVQGLLEAEKTGRVKLDRGILSGYCNSCKQTEAQEGNNALAETAGVDSNTAAEDKFMLPVESPQSIDAAAQRNDVALVVISRNAGEGSDRSNIAGDFTLSQYENILLERLEASPFEKIAVVVNSGGIIDLSWFKRSEKLKALLLAWQPGMEGGRAFAGIVCGDVNPSGRLTDTIAVSYKDYPSSGTFDNHKYEMLYEEDIFLGYRYFETIPEAKDKVLYPFGYGLSYTSFSIAGKSFGCDGKKVRCLVEVTNTGKRSGREVIQLYSSRNGGNMEYPAKELRAFAKSALLAPGESQVIELSFDFNDLAAFDDTGVSGAPAGSFVLEKGSFCFHIGNNIRNTQNIGTYELKETIVLSSPGLLLQSGMRRRMHVDGSFSAMPFPQPSADEDLPYEREDRPEYSPETKPILLSEVAAGKYPLTQFVKQLSRGELVHLSHGQGAFTTGATGGIGNLYRYGIPNPQTSDGPAGVRRLVPTTGFPCGTLLASSWDTDLQYRMGKVFGGECAALGVDILLAPALNIHRNPLCGRNFEYYSEDPLISGRTAAAIVNGIQSQNVGATLKHFAANNREYHRKFTNSIISERALREIYLRGFEIAVKESAPWCVMSGYNLINGRKCSCNYELLSRILREEWGFDGLVMTDWVTHSHIFQEIIAGNDVKMPGRELDLYQQNEYMDHDHQLIPRQVLERNAERILRVIMKTNRFKNQDFGRIYKLKPDSALRLFASQMSSVMVGSSNIAECKDVTGGTCHCHLITIAHGNYCQRLSFLLDAEAAGDYKVSFRLAADRPGSVIELYLDDKRISAMDVQPTAPQRTRAEEKADPGSAKLQSWQTQGEIAVHIEQGMSELNIFIHTATDNATGINMNYIDLVPEK